jgi:hypothetical protein
VDQAVGFGTAWTTPISHSPHVEIQMKGRIMSKMMQSVYGGYWQLGAADLATIEADPAKQVH